MVLFLKTLTIFTPIRSPLKGRSTRILTRHAPVFLSKTSLYDFHTRVFIKRYQIAQFTLFSCQYLQCIHTSYGIIKYVMLRVRIYVAHSYSSLHTHTLRLTPNARLSLLLAYPTDNSLRIQVPGQASRFRTHVFILTIRLHCYSLDNAVTFYCIISGSAELRRLCLCPGPLGKSPATLQCTQTITQHAQR